MQPTEAINLVETVLRDLIREVMGEDWQKDPSVNLEKLERNRAEEQSKRRGVIVSDDLLAFTEFFQLKEIIDRNWSRFEPALEKKKYFDVYMDRLSGFRNPAMHSRSLLSFEESLVLGIVGEFRNMIVKYRSTKGPDMKYYPEITDITDSFGHRLKNQAFNTVLRPGDTVEFYCVGFDPHGRELSWELCTYSKDGSRLISKGGARGNEVTLTWNVTEHDIREMALVLIQLASTGPYHREGDIDQRCSVMYIVRPPPEAFPNKLRSDDPAGERAS